MLWRFNYELTLSEFYNLLSNFLIFIIFIITILFIIIKFRINIKVLRKLAEFSKNRQKLMMSFILILLIISILSFGILKYVIYDLDKSTTVKVDEKILIIEIDDYWNIDETKDYFERYGYTIERYSSVSDIINKYDFVATLGITPYIFVEELRKNFALENDEEMIAYLKELDEKGYELAMHGYNHCRNVNYCPKYEEVWFNIFDGKLELEEIFEKPFTTYFPPGNTWTTEQYENVKRAGFYMVGNTHVPKAYFDESVIITQKGYDPIYIYKWYALDFKHTSYDEWIEEYKEKNLFILQLHCNTFDSQEKLDDLDKFLAYVKKDGAKVMTYRELYDYIKEKQRAKGKDMSGNAIIEIQ